MIVPIFPLPNVVLFPKTVLPLHIFESRYRTMTREVIAGDGKIAIVLLKDGWETDYDRSPAVHDIACVGKIDNYEELDGGKYNIVLTGLHRVRLLHEVEHSPYRRAEIAILQELACDAASDSVITRRNHLGGLCARFAELMAAADSEVSSAALDLDFEALVNTTATTLNLSADDRQALLEMDDLTKRCDVLIPILQQQLETLLLVRRFERLKPDEPRWN